MRWLVTAALAFGLPAGLSAVWLVAQPDERIGMLAGLLYWWMPVVLLFVLAALVCAGLAVQGWGQHLRRLWPGAVLAVALTVVVFTLVPPQMRVQFDETSLVGVSQNMHLQRQAVMTTGAIPFDGQIVALENTVDKRPPLFAFVVSVVHDLSGYRIGNAFFVNAVLLAIALFVAFGAVRQRLGPVAASAAPLLLLSVPLTSIVATSAGFELMASLCFLLTIVAAVAFVQQPNDARLSALLAAGMLFAQSRYESLPALSLLLLLVLVSVRGRFAPSFRSWLLLAACPGLCTPLLFLLQHAQNPNFYPEAAGEELLAAGHFFDHLLPFVSAWFAPSLANPLPGLVAIAALLVFVVRLAKRQANNVDLLAGLPVLAVTTLVLAWFYGNVQEPTALRLFLPLAWLCALLPLASLPWLGRKGGLLLLAAAALLAALRLREVAIGNAFPQLRIAALTEQLDAVVERLPGDCTTTLWVGAPAQHLVVKGLAALSVRSFQRRGYDLQQLRQRGDLRTIYVLETPIDQVMAPAFGLPRELLQQYVSDVVERIGGAMPITVHRLRP